MTLIFLVGLCVVLVTGIIATNRSGVKKRELRATREQRNLAVKALRAIANGSANPVLEAQIALDDVENKQNELE